MYNKVCCVPGCSNSAGSEDVLHKFPNPAKNKDRFNIWIYSVGGDILGLGNEHIFKYRRVCHKHFEEKYWCRNNLLSNIAVPTRNMPGLSLPTSTRRPLRSIENILEASSSKDSKTPEINTHCIAEDAQMLENVEPVAGPSHVNAVPIQPFETYKDIEIKHNLESNKTAISKAVRRKKICTSVSQAEKHLLKKLSRVGVKLSKCRSKVRKQALKIKAMQNIVSHPQLSKALDSLPNTAKMLTLLQFREHKKGIKGRRFTLQEKIMALSI